MKTFPHKNVLFVVKKAATISLVGSAFIARYMPVCEKLVDGENIRSKDNKVTGLTSLLARTNMTTMYGRPWTQPVLSGDGNSSGPDGNRSFRYNDRGHAAHHPLPGTSTSVVSGCQYAFFRQFRTGPLHNTSSTSDTTTSESLTTLNSRLTLDAPDPIGTNSSFPGFIKLLEPNKKSFVNGTFTLLPSTASRISFKSGCGFGFASENSLTVKKTPNPKHRTKQIGQTIQGRFK